MDLIEVAAATSPPMPAETLTREALREWIAGLPSAEKDDYLERFIADEEPSLAAELQQRIRAGNVAATASPTPRTVGALLRAAEDARENRRRAKEARAEVAKKRRERKEALERSQ
jgi:hypothetical protein